MLLGQHPGPQDAGPLLTRPSAVLTLSCTLAGKGQIKAHARVRAARRSCPGHSFISCCGPIESAEKSVDVAAADRLPHAAQGRRGLRVRGPPQLPARRRAVRGPPRSVSLCRAHYNAHRFCCSASDDPPAPRCTRTPSSSASCWHSTEQSRHVHFNHPCCIAPGFCGACDTAPTHVCVERRYGDNQYRFMLMCLAALEAPLNLPLQVRRSSHPHRQRLRWPRRSAFSSRLLGSELGICSSSKRKLGTRQIFIAALEAKNGKV